MAKTKYYALKPHRSGADRSVVKRGDEVHMDALSAQALVDAGILSKDKPEEPAELRAPLVKAEGADPKVKMAGTHANKMADAPKNKKK